MSAVLVAVLLSLVSAVAYAAAAVAQERLASRSGGTLRVLGDGAWWRAVALNASAALLHVVALRYGPLTVVQPLGALTLVAAVPMGARLAGRRVRAVEWRGTALTVAGLAAVLVTASGPAPDDALSAREVLVVAGGTAALIGLLSWPGTRPGLRHAAASGIASGVASALTRTVMVGSGPLPEVVVVAVLGTALLGERLNGGVTGVLLALTGAALAARGVLLLSHPSSSPGTPAPAPARDRTTIPSPAAADRAAAPAIPAHAAGRGQARRRAARVRTTAPHSRRAA